ncbi:MAG: crotonase/enoyl-CoA hydratase family protein [Betaproteobacteria bacterium]
MNAIIDFPVVSSLNSYQQLELEFDPELHTVFSWMKGSPRPCFTSKLLEEVQHFEKLLEANQGHLSHCGRPERVDYVVAGSRTLGVFNLGGDLGMFIEAIMRKERPLLEYYGRLCIENIHRRLTGIGANIPTIALVQGKCLGGGFECALTSDIIVAERSSTFSFPEVLFNLIPGMGGLSLLKRRVGMKKAEDIVMSGQVFTAKEMHELGVVEVLTEDGLGIDTVRKLIAQRQRKSIAYRALYRAKQSCDPVSLTELLEVVNAWVDAALQLETRDLRMMARLLRGQEKMLRTASDDVDVQQLYGAPELAALGSA